MAAIISLALLSRLYLVPDLIRPPLRSGLLATVLLCSLWKVLCGAALAPFLVESLLSQAQAQDVPFHPRHDAIDDYKAKKIKTPVEEREKQRVVYSFARFASSFKLICAALEVDGRRERIYQISKSALIDNFGCSSCRALYRQMVGPCAPVVTLRKGDKRVQRPTPTPDQAPEDASMDTAADEGGKQEGDASQSDSVNGEPDESDSLSKDGFVDGVTAGGAIKDISVKRTPERYPSTELIDAASRMSSGLYELDPDNGSTFKALETFQERVLGATDLTPGERDYYGIFFSYLFSAWEGRPNSPLDPRVKAKEDVSILFQ